MGFVASEICKTLWLKYIYVKIEPTGRGNAENLNLVSVQWIIFMINGGESYYFVIVQQK